MPSGIELSQRRSFDEGSGELAGNEGAHTETPAWAPPNRSRVESGPRTEPAICQGTSWVQRSIRPFLKELVKRKRFSSGLLRSGSVGRTLRSLRVGRARGFLHAGCSLVVLLRLGCRRFAGGSCHRPFRGDCSQHIPSRGTTHDSREQLRRAIGLGRRGFISCEFLTVRATPSKARCCWPGPLRARTAGVVGSKVSNFTLPTRGRTASAQRGPSFTDTKADWRKCGSCGGEADRSAEGPRR
jgi:hypothetical protein